MKLFDPKRPVYSEHDPATPKLLDERGQAIGRLPTLYMDPGLKSGGTVEWTIAVHVPTRSNSWGIRYCTVPQEELQAFAQAWLDDPEAILRDRFKYDFNVDVAGRPWGEKRASTKPSAQPIGLDALFGPELLG